MIDFLRDKLLEYNLADNWQDGGGQFWASILAYAGTIFLILLICLFTHIILKKVIIRAIKVYADRSKNKWDDAFVDHGVPDRLVKIAPAIIIYLFASVFPDNIELWIGRLASSYIIFMVIYTIFPALDSLDTIYSKQEVSRERPIKGLLQVAKIILVILGAILILAVLMDSSPWVLLSGIGVFSAVLMLVFQNTILGFVAGIQLSGNDMVRVGDWIEMPKYNADGDIIEITLHTVKVQNFDRTITMIPTHAMISDSFKNWRGMFSAGGRRIKRSVYIDMSSVSLCTEEMLSRYEKFHLIKDYIQEKQVEIDNYNQEHDIDPSQLVNGRRMTNLGTFRAYVVEYLKNHPKIHKDMLIIVRQLHPEPNGIPIEIYAFTNDTKWKNYEGIQSDIFDHILAIVPQFDLRIFQNPSGADMKQILSDKKQLSLLDKTAKDSSEG
ncbi:MAG TPA: mechanosensitive ion channel domain-containing protein [Bacillota bacterium]|nr:mechanosensitive ion channel domain-containing protein [Bacillota bacterium]